MGVGVLIADDQELVRDGLRTVLERQDGIEVVGEAATGAEAVEMAQRLRPDVVLMDIRMPEVDGLEATRRIIGGMEEPPRVVILTTFDLDEYVFEALRAGASGFLLKDARREDLAQAVLVAASGEALLAPTVTRRLIEAFVSAEELATGAVPEGLDELTSREIEVLELVGRGLSNGEIAERLVVAEKTVKTHIGRIFFKLGLRDRAQAVVFSYECGLVRPSAS
jgi:DNA-binding NarL/FixJ family response regulator